MDKQAIFSRQYPIEAQFTARCSSYSCQLILFTLCLGNRASNLDSTLTDVYKFRSFEIF